MTQDIARVPDWSAGLLISICFGQILKSTDRVLRVDSIRQCGETIEIENTSLPKYDIDKDGPSSKAATTVHLQANNCQLCEGITSIIDSAASILDADRPTKRSRIKLLEAAETLVLCSGPKLTCLVVHFHKYFWFWCQTGIVPEKVYAAIWPVLEITSLKETKGSNLIFHMKWNIKVQF